MKRYVTTIEYNRGLSGRYLLLASIIALCALGIATIGLYQPGSPLQLSRADHFLIQGNVDRALELYQQEVEAGWTTYQRRVAHERMASVLSLEKNKERAAAEEWESLAQLTTSDGSNPARYWTNAATHYVIDGTVPERAARAFTMAAKSSASEEESASLALLAGQQWVRSGSTDEAERVWVHISNQYPSHRSDALSSLGKLSLGLGHTEEALTWFEDAVDAARNEAQRLNGKMGVQMSLERLGNLDEAIAELNETGLSEALRDVRTQKMLERGEKLQMQ